MEWKHALANFLLVPLFATLEEDIMKPFALLADRPARWNSPMRWKRRFELVAGEDTYAAMEFEKACGTLVVARTLAQAWTLSTEGSWDGQVSVRDAIRGDELAAFHGDWRGGGRVERAAGRGFVWSGANPWMTRWVFRSGSGAPLVEFRLDAMRLVPSGIVRFEPGVAETDDAPLLAVLGWYLALQAFEQAEFGTIVAAGS